MLGKQIEKFIVKRDVQTPNTSNKNSLIIFYREYHSPQYVIEHMVRHIEYFVAIFHS